jgi:hypothetical protein
MNSVAGDFASQTKTEYRLDTNLVLRGSTALAHSN